MNRKEKNDVTTAPNPDQLMSVSRLAEYLDVPETTIYQWKHRRTGPPAIKVGKHLRYRRSEVDRWLDSQTVGGEQPK